MIDPKVMEDYLADPGELREVWCRLCGTKRKTVVYKFQTEPHDWRCLECLKQARALLCNKEPA